MNQKNVLVIGGVAVGLYLLYKYLQQSCPANPTGTLCSTYAQIAGMFGGTAATTPTTPTTTTTAPTTTSAPPVITAPPVVTPPPPVAPPPATVTIVGAVTPNINNSLSANVTVNGQTMNLSIIPPGTAYNTSGQDITAQLTANGVNVPALYQQFQASYVPPLSQVGTAVNTGIRPMPIFRRTAPGNPVTLSGINDYPEYDLAYPYVFGKSSLSGVAGDERFAHSRVPASMIHQGPRYGFRRGA